MSLLSFNVFVPIFILVLVVVVVYSLVRFLKKRSN